MSARARPPEVPASSTRTVSDGLAGGRDIRLWTALALAVLGSVFLTFGGITGVLAGARPGYLAWPLLAALAALPAALAIGLAWRGRPNVAVGVLAAGAVLAPGRMLLDAQFVADAALAARPELYVAVSLESPSPQLGLWLLLAGHAATLLAGVVALSSLHNATEPEGPTRRTRQQALSASTLLGIAAAAALALPAFHSDNVYLVSGSALDGPELVMGGTLVLAVAIPLSAALSVTARSWHVTRGTLLGLAAGVTALELPNLVSVMALPWLHLASGPIVGLVAASGLGAFAVWPLRPGGDSEPPAEPHIPSQRRLHVATGVLAMLTAGCAVVGGSTPHLMSLLDGSVIAAPSSRLLLVAAVLVAIPGAAMFLPNLAGTVRPVLAVVWVTVVFAGASLLATSVVAAKLPGATQPGPGVWWTVLAMVGALLLSVCTVVAGIVDREMEAESADRDLAERSSDPRLRVVAAVSAVLAIGAFGASTIDAPEFVGSGLWHDFGVPFWGLLAALLVVLGVLALAPRCRPARATALLTGAVGVVGVRALELPLVGGRVADSAAGVGSWLAFACLLSVAVGAALSAVSHRDSRRR
ncbi:MAG: hypothetical protein ACRDQ7_23765 [Haloechinothrix sp.]